VLPTNSAALPPPPPSTIDKATRVLGVNANPVSSKDPEADNNCFLPPLNGLHTGTIEVAGLQVPAKTQREYETACADARSRKMPAAETHLRKAVKQYPKYSAAWILLGQVLAAQMKTEEARDACSNPLNSGSKYLPAYLCLTDISARSNNWDDVLKFSSRAIEIDQSAAAYAYNATANLNLHHLAEAEKSALKASAIDSNNQEPRLHFLLAQVYAAKGDRPNEAAQLREYLKYAKDPDDAALVKSYLAKLDTADSSSKN
jgi:predicted Zn-dependent protease